MNLIQWDPWEELERLREKTDRLWDNFLGKLTSDVGQERAIAFLPDIDFVESPGEYRVYLSVPGLIEEDIDLTIGEHELTVRGQRQCPYDVSHAQARVHEWRYGYFERHVGLPRAIRPDAVRASYDTGVLTVILPKA